MLRPRDIIRGTFRLSLVAAVSAAAYSAYTGWEAYQVQYKEAWQKDFQLQTTLECGARIPNEELKRYENVFGLVDLSKVGCSRELFLARYEEMRDAREGKLQKFAEMIPPPHTTHDMLFYGLAWLLGVNLLGFALLGVWSVSRWVTRGYRPSV